MNDQFHIKTVKGAQAWDIRRRVFYTIQTGRLDQAESGTNGSGLNKDMPRYVFLIF